jgi:FKBP-type peptidyl-prolyl cis-trans isomerase
MANESSNGAAPTAPKPSASAPTASATAAAPPPRPAASSIPAPDDVAAAPASAKKTASGLAYKVLKPGTGAAPKATDRVTVNYTGWTTDGKMFDSSVTRGQPATFPLNGVIKGWTEGVQLMKTGEKTRFWIPAELAYGEHPAGGRPGGLLVFDIELISIAAAPAPGAPPQGHP